MTLQRTVALVLLAALGAGSGSGCATLGTASRTAAPTARVNHLLAVAYHERPGDGPRGVVAPITVAVRPNHSDEVRVATFETLSGAAGEQWRAATWVGAVQAEKLLGRSLRQDEISVSVEDLVDGPSAGALLTAGLVATIQGVQTRPDVTMTGTINPDGTIGPVGGIRHKMQAAAAAGLRAFGYPRGQRFEVDEAGSAVDLTAFGTSLGLEVREIGDVEESYELLTGREISRATPLPRSAIRLDPDVEARMQEQIREWTEEVSEGVIEYRRQPSLLRKFLRPSMELAAQALDDANRYLRQGQISMAHLRARDAMVRANGVSRSARLLRAAVTEDFEAIGREVTTAAAVESEIQSFVASTRRHRPATVGEALNLIQTYDQIHQARAFVQSARENVARAVRVAEAIDPGETSRAARDLQFESMGALSIAAVEYQAAACVLDLARNGNALDMGRGSEQPVDLDRLRDLAHATTVAAKAVFDYYDAVLVRSAADYHRASVDAVRADLLQRDRVFRSAAIHLGFALEHREAKDVHDALEALAASEQAYIDASLLVMRDYSLGVRLHEGQPVAIHNDVALVTALDQADERARESAAVAAATLGAVPARAASLYQRSWLLGQGTLDDRLMGLHGFWSVSVAASTATALTASAPR